MTFEYLGGNFHCGRPWTPYGIPVRAAGLLAHRGPAGRRGAVPELPQLRQPGRPARHRAASRKLTAVGRDNLTYEGTYWRWIQRAWMGGLRLIVMPVNENRVLCELQTNRADRLRRDGRPCARARRHPRSCRTTSTPRPAGRARASSRSSPTRSRRGASSTRARWRSSWRSRSPSRSAAAAGTTPTCDQAQVDNELDELYDRGVRSSLLLNKFDNPLTGVRFDSGADRRAHQRRQPASAPARSGARRPAPGPLHDNTDRDRRAVQTRRDRRAAGPGSACAAGSLPAYPPAPHCNTRGLTDLGAHRSSG